MKSILINKKSIAALTFVAAAAFACKTTQSSKILEADDLYDAGVSMQEVEQAMKVVGANNANNQGFCAQACHGGSNWHEVTQNEIVTKWLPSTQKMNTCFEDAEDAKARIACFQKDGEYTTDSIKSLGVFRAGAKTAFFKSMFEEVYPDEAEGQQKFTEMLAGGGAVPKAPMPVPDENLEGPSLSENQFTNLINVMTDPRAEEKINNFFGEVVATNEVCSPNATPELKTHVSKMMVNGWGARLLTQDYNKFYGCEYRKRDFTGKTYKDILELPVTKCFQNPNDEKLSHVFSAWEKEMSDTWDQVVDEKGQVISQNINILSDLGGCLTTFWMRSSPDGRYVGNGSRGGDCELAEGSSGFITDLKYQKHIGVNAPYDPGFMPDNSGFTFIAGSAAHFCSMEALNPGARSADTVPDFFRIEAGKYCGNGKLGVYQHIGASVDPAKPQYTVVRSNNYANDDGGSAGYKLDPSVQKFAKAASDVELYKMCNKSQCSNPENQGIAVDVNGDGKESAYGISDSFLITIPYEGDFGITPSSELLTSRIAKKDGESQVGYSLRSYDIANKTSKDVGTVCMRGGKASVSFNERYLVTHHFTDDQTYKVKGPDGKVYERSDWTEFNKSISQNKFTGPEDPEFRKYVENSANIWIADVLTGKSYRLTFMKPGQFALYPHFRADGLMYFLVRDYNQNKHFVVVTDAALQIELNQNNMH